MEKSKHIKNVLVAPIHKVLAFGTLFFHAALVHSGCPLTERPGCAKDFQNKRSSEYMNYMSIG